MKPRNEFCFVMVFAIGIFTSCETAQIDQRIAEQYKNDISSFKQELGQCATAGDVFEFIVKEPQEIPWFHGLPDTAVQGYKQRLVEWRKGILEEVNAKEALLERIRDLHINTLKIWYLDYQCIGEDHDHLSNPRPIPKHKANYRQKHGNDLYYKSLKKLLLSCLNEWNYLTIDGGNLDLGEFVVDWHMPNPYSSYSPITNYFLRNTSINSSSLICYDKHDTFLLEQIRQHIDHLDYEDCDVILFFSIYAIGHAITNLETKLTLQAGVPLGPNDVATENLGGLGCSYLLFDCKNKQFILRNRAYGNRAWKEHTGKFKKKLYEATKTDYKYEWSYTESEEEFCTRVLKELLKDLVEIKLPNPGFPR